MLYYSNKDGLVYNLLHTYCICLKYLYIIHTRAHAREVDMVIFQGKEGHIKSKKRGVFSRTCILIPSQNDELTGRKMLLVKAQSDLS